MAHIRRLPSGKWNAVVRLPDGKRRSIIDPLKRVVEQRARDIESAISRGEAVHLRDRRVTVAQWHAKWLKTRMVEASTARKDDSRWRNHVRTHCAAAGGDHRLGTGGHRRLPTRRRRQALTLASG